LKSIQATPKEQPYKYYHTNHNAQLPDPNVERSAFFKLRSLAIIFKLRKTPRDQLKQMSATLNVKYRDLTCDMPVRWNSTHKLLQTGLHLEKPLRAVLLNQTWDDSVREKLSLDDEDWTTLKEMALFFQLFEKPTVQSQADKYPTLHNVIPNYLHILRQLRVWKLQHQQNILQTAAIAAYEVIFRYYKTSITTRSAFVALICDPRLKMEVLAHLFDADGGVGSHSYQRARNHFVHTFREYKKRAIGLADWKRQQEEQEEVPEPEVIAEDLQAWRVDPLHSWDDYLAARPVNPAGRPPISELDRWLSEDIISRYSTPDEVRLYLQSKRFDFPIITQIARDYLAIPATSAPSERVFSLAGNLISTKRTRILSKNIRYILYLRS